MEKGCLKLLEKFKTPVKLIQGVKCQTTLRFLLRPNRSIQFATCWREVHYGLSQSKVFIWVKQKRVNFICSDLTVNINPNFPFDNILEWAKLNEMSVSSQRI